MKELAVTDLMSAAERFGLPLSKSRTLLGRVATEADQSGLAGVKCQFERAHSFMQVLQKSLYLPPAIAILKGGKPPAALTDLSTHNRVLGSISERSLSRQCLMFSLAMKRSIGYPQAVSVKNILRTTSALEYSARS
jgi:hypothetical protein